MLEVSYNYYETEYGGNSIPSNSFKKNINNAIKKVNFYTFNRLNNENIDNNVKDTVCEIAEFLYTQEQLKKELLDTTNRIITSETVGPHSVTYENKTSQIDKIHLSDDEIDSNTYEICYRNLAHTGLMYRGL